MIEPLQSHRHLPNHRPRARARRRRCVLAATSYDSPTPCRSSRHCKGEGGKRLGSRSRDPIGYEGSEWNLYEYCAGNSLRHQDPTGMDIGAIPLSYPSIELPKIRLPRISLPSVGTVARTVARRCSYVAAGSIGYEIGSSIAPYTSVPLTEHVLRPEPIKFRLVEEGDSGGERVTHKPVALGPKACEFYYLWCKWGAVLKDTDPGKPYWPLTLDECDKCYSKCQATGNWNCVMGGGRNGPRWPGPSEPWKPVYPD